MNEHETAVFKAAAERLQLKTIDAPRFFGVARQTFANWINGKTKVPPAAFVTLLELENDAAQRIGERANEIKALAARVKACDFTTAKIEMPPPLQRAARRRNSTPTKSNQ